MISDAGIWINVSAINTYIYCLCVLFGPNFLKWKEGQIPLSSEAHGPCSQTLSSSICLTDFSECTIEEDPEYRTFDDMKHDFEGIHSYVLVQSTGLPKNLPDVYVEGINRIKNDQDADSEEDHNDDQDSRGRDDSDEEDSSEEHGDSGFPRELKIRVYNHTVEFKKNRKLYVSYPKLPFGCSSLCHDKE